MELRPIMVKITRMALAKVYECDRRTISKWKHIVFMLSKTDEDIREAEFIQMVFSTTVYSFSGLEGTYTSTPLISLTLASPFFFFIRSGKCEQCHEERSGRDTDGEVGLTKKIFHKFSCLLKGSDYPNPPGQGS